MNIVVICKAFKHANVDGFLFPTVEMGISELTTGNLTFLNQDNVSGDDFKRVYFVTYNDGDMLSDLFSTRENAVNFAQKMINVMDGEDRNITLAEEELELM